MSSQVVSVTNPEHDSVVRPANTSLTKQIGDQFDASPIHVHTYRLNGTGSAATAAYNLDSLPGLTTLVSYFPFFEVVRMEFVFDSLESDTKFMCGITADSSAAANFDGITKCLSRFVVRSTALTPGSTVAEVKLYQGVSRVLKPLSPDGKIPRVLMYVNGTQDLCALSFKVHFRVAGPMIVHTTHI